jgi:uncharacterized protein
MTICIKAASITGAVMLHLAASGLAVASDSPASEIQEQRNKEAVTAAFGRWAAGGTGFFQEILSPDVVWIIKGTSPMAGTYNGRDALIARAVVPFSRRLSAPIKPNIRNVWADGDHVIVYWDGVATAKDGQPYNNSYAWIFRMKEDRAVEVTAFLDLVPYDSVLGRIKLPE